MRRPAQALVEFALVISVFMLLVLGTFDLARAYLAYVVVTNSAREATHYGSVHVGQINWQSAAAQAGTNLAIGIDPSALTLTVSTRSVGSLLYITASGSYLFHSITPGVGVLLGDPINMHVDTATLAG